MRLKAFLWVGVFSLISSLSALGGLDLKFTGKISMTPNPAAPGDTVKFNVSFNNDGAVVDNLLCIGGVDNARIFERIFAHIAAGKNRMLVFNWPATGGSHTVWFELDPNRFQKDENSRNNRVEMTINVAVKNEPEQEKQQKLPDLILREAYATPSVKEGSLNSFSCTAENKGTSYKGQWIMTFLVDDTIVAGRESHDLREGQIGGSQYDWRAQGIGKHRLTCIVDRDNKITESNESNNTKSIDFEVTAKEEARKLPDFELRQAYATPSVKEGSLNSFSCTAENKGASYKGQWIMTFLVDDTIVAGRESHDLREGQIGGSQYDWRAQGIGKHRLTCIVDRDNKITESNENNNSSSVEFVVTESEAPAVKKPDLIVKEFKFKPDNATTADALYTSFKLKNQGDGIATFRQGDNYIEFTDPINRTPRRAAINTGRAYQPGEEFSPHTFHYSPNQVAAGDYTITVRVDPDNVIDESNEDNNTLTFNWSLAQGGTPDLIISEMRVAIPESPIFNNIYRYNIYVTIRNQGTGPAYMRYKALECPDIYIPDMVGTQKIDPNGTYQVTLAKDNPPVGTYNWRFTVDPANQVAESDETNNSRSVQFVVSMPEALADKKPDLIVKEFKFKPDNATTADALYTSFRLKNQGDGIATFRQGDNYIEFTDPINRTPRRAAINTGRAYQPGEEFSPHTFHYSPNQVAAGDYTITVRVDPDNVIDESNEDNNTFTFNWSLAQGGAPDLIISEIRVVIPESPIFNNIYRYNIYVTIRNQGTGPAYMRYKALECPDIYIPDMVGTQKIDPNGTYQVTLAKDNPPAGTYNWRFTVDPANQVAESDETNNVKTVVFIVNP